jgi:hypothetical protein
MFNNILSPAHVVRDPSESAFTLSALRILLRKREIALFFTVYFMFFKSFVFLQAVSTWWETFFGFGPL